jgi:hypothetical protein
MPGQSIKIKKENESIQMKNKVIKQSLFEDGIIYTENY